MSNFNEYKLKAAGANIAVARANYFPSISLTGRMGYSSTNLKQLFKTSAFGWSFGPSISVPLFDAGQLDANYQVAQIARKQALTGYEKSIQAAFKEVADVLAARATLEERLETQYRLQDNFQQMYTIADARYKAGLDSYLSVLDAQRSEFSSQQSILNLEKAKAMSQVQLYQVLGGGVTIDTPVTLTVPNHKKPVAFIAPKTPYYTSDKKPIENHGNPARLSSTAKVGTVEQVNQLK
ncbi:TolC family protein [Psychrobacter sp. HD31]|uniref:TolC family protein n=1 Tax=Psychrobacter sp. HD31 TaxID=3112003 RepID=UPI003DA1D117